MAGRTPWLNRSDSRKIWPSVIEMTLVGMKAEMSFAFVSMIGRPVIEPPPISSESFAQRSSSRRVQVEDVTGVGLAARRAAQQQRHGAVRLGLLAQVVEDDEHVLAAVHPVLADRRAGVRGEVLEAGRVARPGRRRWSCTPSRRAPRACPSPTRWWRPSVRSRRRCSAPALTGSPESQLAFWLRIVSIATVVLPVLRSPMMSWRWPRPMAVIESMALMPVCSGLLHGLAGHDVGRLQLELAEALVLDLAQAVDRLPERVHHAAEELVARPAPRAPGRSA